MNLLRSAMLAVAVLALSWAPAHADMAISNAYVEFRAGAAQRDDIEVRNEGGETMYIMVDVEEVLEPGTDREHRVSSPDPEALGLLVSPRRLVVEPGSRRVVRLSLIAPPIERDRIWRVTFRPVVGELKAETTAIRVLIAYGALVVARPSSPVAEIVAERAGSRLTLVNRGRSNALLYDGRQCDAGGDRCVDLPTRRLYAGNIWEVELPYDTPATWRIRSADGTSAQSF